MSTPEKPERVSELGSWFSFPCPPIPLPSLLSKLNIRVVKPVDFREPPLHQGGSDEQEVYRAAHGRRTSDLRSDNREETGKSEKLRRASILLKSDADGPAWDDAKISEAVGCRTRTVENVRQTFVFQVLMKLSFA